MLCRSMKQQTMSYGSSCIWLETQTVSSSKLSAASGVSPRYLLQVGAKLRDAELISTTHDPAGGYDLKKPPSEISLFDIILVMAERQNQDRRIYLSEQIQELRYRLWVRE